MDNGSASFIPLSNYLLENDAVRVLRDAGCDVFIHVIITGGQALLETLEGFRALATASSPQNIVVWLNEYFGPIERHVCTGTRNCRLAAPRAFLDFAARQ